MSRSRQHTILVAEEHTAAREAIGAILTELGHLVIYAESCEQVVFLAVQRNIDALLISLNLPDGSTATLTKRLRSMQRYVSAPVILLATSSSDATLIDVLDDGADDFVLKPVNPSILKTRLRGLLRRLDDLRELEESKDNLNRYVSDRTKNMVDEYTATGVMPEPQEREVTVMFADVRGFTSMSEEMNNNTLFNMLSRHLAMQVEAVYRHGGYVTYSPAQLVGCHPRIIACARSDAVDRATGDHGA